MNSFEEWIGHRRIVKSLQKAIERQQVSHAYIFEGEVGMGKLEMAKLFAKTLQCEEKGINPCNVCPSCIQFDTHNHPDVKYVKSSKKSIGVDVIREQIEEDILEKPYRYEKKIYIVERADRMTEQAQNALLKTIEEPPSYGVILLLTDRAYSFLPTILSRCVLLKFQPYTPREMEGYIESLKLEEATLEERNMVIEFSEGNPGKAKDFLTSDQFKEMRENFFRLLQKINHAQGAELLTLGEQLEKQQDQLSSILDLFIIWYRDVLLVKLLGERAKVLNQDKKALLGDESRNVEEKLIYHRLKILREVKRQLDFNANVQLAMEVLLLKWN